MLDFLDIFETDDNFLLVDPVMGDNGARYPVFSPQMESEMRLLAARADLITPNLTELCLLAGEDCRVVKEIRDGERLKMLAEEMANALLTGRTKEAVVTGIRYTDEETGMAMIRQSGGHKRRGRILRRFRSSARAIPEPAICLRRWWRPERPGATG